MSFQRFVSLLVGFGVGAANAETHVCNIKPQYGRVTIAPEIAISISPNSKSASVIDGVLHASTGRGTIGNVEYRSNQTRVTWVARLDKRTTGNVKKDFVYRATLWSDGKIIVTGEVENYGDFDRARAKGVCQKTEKTLDEIGAFGQRLDKPLRRF